MSSGLRLPRGFAKGRLFACRPPYQVSEERQRLEALKRKYQGRGRETISGWVAILVLGSALTCFEVWQHYFRGAAAPWSADDDIDKDRVLIIGSGWAGVSCLHFLDRARFSTTLLSAAPACFTYTPALSSAAVGRSLLDLTSLPMDRVIDTSGVRLVAGDARAIDPVAKVVHATARDGRDLVIPYDVLILAVGDATAATARDRRVFALRTPQDAIMIHEALSAAIDEAMDPETSPERRAALLHVRIAGDALCAADLAADLRWFGARRLARRRPDLWHAFRVSFEEQPSPRNAHEDRIRRVLGRGTDDASPHHLTIQTRPHDPDAQAIVRNLAEQAPPEMQPSPDALVCDAALRVRGFDGDIYAIGDCASVSEADDLGPRLVECLRSFDVDGDGHIDREEFVRLAAAVARQDPQAGVLLEMAFGPYDRLDLQAVAEMIAPAIDVRTRRFPRTAGVAYQEGRHVAESLNRSRRNRAFRYKHLGGHHYVGASQPIETHGSRQTDVIAGLGATWMWRSAEWTRVVPLFVRAARGVEGVVRVWENWWRVS